MRYRTLLSTRLVTSRGPNVGGPARGTARNMYGCLPCPRCGDGYRYPMKDGFIHCDNCGKKQRAEYGEDWR